MLIRFTMKTLKKIICIFLFTLPVFVRAEVKEIPFTLDDRDRIIRTEQKVESMNAEMNARFDQLFNFLWAIIGIFTTMMVAVFGFAFWDRRLSLSPLKRENARVIEVLRDFSEHQPKLREILKHDLPPAPHGLWATWKEIVPILKKQKEDPSYVFIPKLPQGQGDRVNDEILEREAAAQLV